MTTATFAPSRPGVFADVDARFSENLLAPLRRAWTRFRVYRKTLADLEALSIHQRDDLGIAGLDLEAIAREAVRAN